MRIVLGKVTAWIVLAIGSAVVVLAEVYATLIVAYGLFFPVDDSAAMRMLATDWLSETAQRFALSILVALIPAAAAWLAIALFARYRHNGKARRASIVAAMVAGAPIIAIAAVRAITFYLQRPYL